MGRVEACKGLDLEWRDDISGKAVSHGDRIPLGDLEVQVLETPGHSSCSISAYVPQLKALFPSDGGGIPLKDTIIMSGNSNYTQFQQSLERLLPLEVDYLCADHYGYIVGQEARGFMTQAMERARQTRAVMEAAYLRTRDVDAAAQELCDAFFGENPDYILTPEIFGGVFRQMVRHVAKELERGRA
jgi:glyoxylase-like metal-dependent hydrolase (beta-lactamase superfamily II)